MRNLLSGFLSRFLIIILGMIVRTIFIAQLGNDYLSVNGLYSNILNMLSLAELGFSTAMVYSMYKPLAENDDEKLASLMKLYGQAYRIIGSVIFLLGLAIIPFMDRIIKDPPDLDHLTFYYILFLANTSLSYLAFSYKRSILTADQKEYVCTGCRMVFHIVKSTAQILLLLFTHSYTAYLIAQLLSTVGENLVIAHVADKTYPALKIKHPKNLEKSETRRIMNDIKALSLSRISHIVLNSTDNMIISAFVGISWVGILSNYTLIIDSITGVLCQITSAISASLGNYFVKESREKGYALFNRIEYMNSWIYGFCMTMLIVLLEPFITLWLGTKYVLGTKIEIIIAINFFMQGYINTLWTVRSTLGLFTQGWYRPVMVTVLNIVLSIWLGIKWGVFGVLVATTISRAIVNVWFDPLIIHKYGFNVPTLPFLFAYLKRIALMTAIIAVLLAGRHFLLSGGVTVARFAVLTAGSVLVFFAGFWLFNHRKNEYRYFKEFLLQKVILPLKSRLFSK